MLWTVIFVFFVGNVCGDGKDVESRVVTTKQGPVRGYKSPDGDFFVFYGVPYAAAPTGLQRYQAPLPPPVRTDIFEAVERNTVCVQNNYLGLVLNGDRQGKENCLIANIYVPKTEEKKLPVLVVVHGGGFIIGFGDFTTPKQLAMMKKAIIVNFNYRLGAQGFLCLGTKNVPGNAGMKDQVALLRWVKDNIASFGGDPNDVTINGASAGSVSVDLLMLSKMGNGLFNKVIPESGSSTATFAIQLNPVETAKKYAKQLNFTNVEDISALEDFYMTAPYDLLTSVDLLSNVDSTLMLTPCVERDVGVERFLEDSPVDILKTGTFQKRPMLYGFAKMEGMARLPVFDTFKEIMNNKFSDIIPANLKFKNDNEKEDVAAKVKNFYFGSKDVNGDTIMGYIDYFTDIMFSYSTLLSVRLQVAAGNNQIYLYEYDYAGESSSVIPFIGAYGADHCAQTWAVQDGLNFTHPDESMASDGFKTMKRMLREMWFNFITTSKPVPEGSSLPVWPPTGTNGSPHMILDEVPQLKDTPLLVKRIRFWDDIYSKHYLPPVPPSTPRVLNTEL